MLFLVFGHTAEEPPLRIGPLPRFRIAGALIHDHEGKALARHNGARWVVGEKVFYRMDCEGPVAVQLEGCEPPAAIRGPFAHFSLFNGTAYVSRDLFAHYDEPSDCWLLHGVDSRCTGMTVAGVTAASVAGRTG